MNSQKRTFDDLTNEDIEHDRLTGIVNTLIESELDGETPSYTTQFLSPEDFLERTTLNQVTVPDHTLAETIYVSDKEFERTFAEFNFTPESLDEYLNKESTTRKNAPRIYSNDVYEMIVAIMMYMYASKFQGDIMTIVEMFISMIKAHKHHCRIPYGEIKKILTSSSNTPVSMDLARNKLLSWIDRKFKKARIEQPEETTERSPFFDNHKELYNDVIKPFMSLGWFFDSMDPISKAGFRTLTRSTTKRRDDTVSSLRVNLTKPVFCKLTAKNVKGTIKIVGLQPEASEQLIAMLKSKLRFKNSRQENVQMDFYDNIAVCNLLSAQVYNLYHAANSYPHEQSMTQWSVDLIDSSHSIYIAFDSLHLTYTGDVNKVTVKAFPIYFNTNVLATSKVAMINAPIEKEVLGDDYE